MNRLSRIRWLMALEIDRGCPAGIWQDNRWIRVNLTTDKGVTDRLYRYVAHPLNDEESHAAQ